MCQLHTTKFGERSFSIILAWCLDSVPVVASNAASSAKRTRPLQSVDVDLDSLCPTLTLTPKLCDCFNGVVSNRYVYSSITKARVLYFSFVQR